MRDLSEPAFRAEQIFRWIHVNRERSYGSMTNLPEALRKKLDEALPFRSFTLEREQTSAIDGTRKYLFRLFDGEFIESVRMRYRYGDTICISSQAGCRMGCRFCASTLNGLSRSLGAGEMLDQVAFVEGRDGELGHIVVMGMGEPFDNYDELIRFLRLITDPDGRNFSIRNITVSTCGLVPQIRRFKEEGLPVNLALSLHAPNDELRKELLPIANTYTIEETLEALWEYFAKTGRRITLEYSLIEGVNDREEDAEALIRLLKGRNCLVNLIPVNPVAERGYRPTKSAQVAVFQKKLEKNGIHGTIRRELGRDIDASCGQLRKRHVTG